MNKFFICIVCLLMQSLVAMQSSVLAPFNCSERLYRWQNDNDKRLVVAAERRVNGGLKKYSDDLIIAQHAFPYLVDRCSYLNLAIVTDEQWKGQEVKAFYVPGGLLNAATKIFIPGVFSLGKGKINDLLFHRFFRLQNQFGSIGWRNALPKIVVDAFNKRMKLLSTKNKKEIVNLCANTDNFIPKETKITFKIRSSNIIHDETSLINDTLPYAICMKKTADDPYYYIVLKNVEDTEKNIIN